MDTDAAVFEGKINGLLDHGWDLFGNLIAMNATTNVDSPDIELTTLFQAMTKAVEEDSNVQTAKKG